MMLPWQDRQTGKQRSTVEDVRRRRTRERRSQRRASARAHRRTRRTAVLKALACIAIVGLCLVMALMVGDPDYQASPIGWIPLIAVVTAIALAWLYLQVLKRSLQFSEESDLGDCQRDQDVHLCIHFRNTSLLFFFRIEAYFYISDMFGRSASEAMTTLALAPRESFDLNFAARFEHIGTYSAGLKSVVITDFLRLFTAEIPNNHRQWVQVTPRLQPLERVEFSNESIVETQKAAKSALADSMDYAYVRNYVPGDPLKTIHWKLSARTENYMTRLYEVYTNPGVAIVMDFYGPSDSARTLMSMFDAIVETAFSLGRYTRAQGMDTEICYVNKDGEQVRVVSWREDEMAKVVDDLPRMSNSATREAEAFEVLNDQITSQYGQNNLVVCSANISADMVSTLIEAKNHRRNPLMFAIVPNDLVDRERDDYTASLQRLDAADISYMVLARSDELVGAKA